MPLLKWSPVRLVTLIALIAAMPALAPLLVSGQVVRQAVTPLEQRKFYVTLTMHAGNDALTACGAGFHMASMFEILDPSNLAYDTTRGFTQADAGSGPPTTAFGWVRTGGEANESGIPGTSNCAAWTSNNPFGEGTAVALTRVWAVTETSEIHPWFAGGGICSEPLRVWCVQN